MDPLTIWVNWSRDARFLYGLTSVLFGLLYLFWGFKIFRFLVMLAGFLTGLVAGGAAGAAIGFGNTGTAWLLGIVFALAGGLLLAWVFWHIYWIGVFVFGGAILGLLAAGLWLAGTGGATSGGATSGGAVALFLVAFVLGGIVAVVAQKAILIVGTALNGAESIVVGTYSMVMANHPDAGIVNAIIRGASFRTYGATLLAGILVILALTVWGAIYQYRTVKPRPAPRRDAMVTRSTE